MEDLEYLLNSTSVSFDVIAISETRIVKGKTPVNSLDLKIIVMIFVLLNYQLDVRFYKYEITCHVNLEMMIYVFIKLQS